MCLNRKYRFDFIENCPDEVKNEIKNNLLKNDELTIDDISRAMTSRICDLENTINIKYVEEEKMEKYIIVRGEAELKNIADVKEGCVAFSWDGTYEEIAKYDNLSEAIKNLAHRSGSAKKINNGKFPYYAITEYWILTKIYDGDTLDENNLVDAFVEDFAENIELHRLTGNNVSVSQYPTNINIHFDREINVNVDTDGCSDFDSSEMYDYIVDTCETKLGRALTDMEKIVIDKNVQYNY